jgi:hypothetical protein
MPMWYLKIRYGKFTVHNHPSCLHVIKVIEPQEQFRQLMFDVCHTGKSAYRPHLKRRDVNDGLVFPKFSGASFHVAIYVDVTLHKGEQIYLKLEMYSNSYRCKKMWACNIELCSGVKRTEPADFYIQGFLLSCSYKEAFLWAYRYTCRCSINVRLHKG